jgi:EAL and modified HD-GYP domain-containing signal transduction protein
MEFIARQPIFDLQHNLVAYELLHRSSEENRCAQPNLEIASRQMMGTAMLLGFDTLSSGHTVFINCTEEMLRGGYVTLFPAEQTVVEVLETVEPSPHVVRACRDLKKAGYTIALDDFDDRHGQAQLIDVADIVKVDFRLTSAEERGQMVRRYATNGRIMLAEKVESNEEFSSAAEQGYQLFQGYFFCKPKMLSTKSVRSVNPLQLRVMRLLSRDTLDFQEVEMLIKSDPALCFRLLRYLNSAAYCFRREVRSVLEAVTMLGEKELRKWLLLVSAIMAGNRNPELVKTAVMRARFAETLGPKLGVSGPVAFLLGLLSLMHVILDLLPSEVAEQLAIPEEIRDALLGNPGPLQTCLEVVLDYETGNWDKCDTLLRECNVQMDALVTSYRDAVKWAELLMSKG